MTTARIASAQDKCSPDTMLRLNPRIARLLRRNRSSQKLAAFAVPLLLLAGVAHAQIPGGNIFVGYSISGGDVYSGCNGCAPGGGTLTPPSRSTTFNGIEASLEGKFLPWVGIMVDGSRGYASARFDFVCPVPPGGPACGPANRTVDSKLSTLLIGPQVSVSIGRFTPFAHALFGIGHITGSGGASNSDTAFATAIGGGIDYKLIKGLAWRFQGDEMHTRFFTGTQDHFRFSTGIVLRF